MTLGEMLDDVRPWLSTAGILALCEFARRLWVQNRTLRMAENKDDRDGYGALISTLQAAILNIETKHAAEMAALRSDYDRSLERIEGEHRRCEERLSKIEGELMGFHRQALLQSQQGVAQLPASAMIRDAADRAVKAAGGEE